MAVYLDFFLQVFIHALAWALAASIAVFAFAVMMLAWSSTPGWRRGGRR